MDDAAPLPEVDARRAHPARVYNYWLGGKDHFEIDREVGDAMIAELPGLPMMARAHRQFLERVIRYQAGEAGARQFLLFGCGLPTTYNLHQVAQEIEPAARIVYVDPDPVIAAHARALMISGPKGTVEFVLGDVGDPAAVLADPGLTAALDLDEPVAIGLSATLMPYSDAVAREIIATLLGAVPPGSLLTLCHPTAEFDPDATGRALEMAQQAEFRHATRTLEQVSALLSGLDLVEPGVVPILGWRPDGGPRRDERSVHLLGGVGRKSAAPDRPVVA